MGGSTDSLKKILGMRTFKVRSDEMLVDAKTEEPKRCMFIRGKGYCDRDCTYYNETDGASAGGIVLCRCLEEVMGFVTK